MSGWTLFYTKEAEKDSKKLKQASLKKRWKAFCGLLSKIPFKTHRPLKNL
jgi:mRNA-degrading endonuclease RelE of RelBE toxin-antitoxin system